MSILAQVAGGYSLIQVIIFIIILCGVLAALCLVSGLVVGGLRMTLRRAGASGEGDAMISLRITGRP